MSSITATTGARLASDENSERQAAWILWLTSRGSIEAKENAWILDADAVRERGRRLLGVRRHVGRDEVVTEPLDPFEGDLRRIAIADVREPLEDLRERPVGDPVAVRQASPAHDRRRRVESICPADELGDEPALADARVAVDRDEVRPSLLGRPLVEAPQELELAVASDHRRAQPRDASLRRAGRAFLQRARLPPVAPCLGAPARRVRGSGSRGPRARCARPRRSRLVRRSARAVRRRSPRRRSPSGHPVAGWSRRAPRRCSRRSGSAA